MKSFLILTLLLILPALSSAQGLATGTDYAISQLENAIPASTTVTGYFGFTISYLKTHAPVVIDVSVAVYAKIESLRSKGHVLLSAEAEKILKEISDAGVIASHPAPPGSPTPTSTSYKTVGKQLEYLALTGLAYVFAHKWFFYPIVLVLSWWILRKVLRLIIRLIRGRPSYD